MKLRVVVSLLGVLAFFGGVARAQERQTVEVFAGYSYLRANPATSGVDGFSLNGGSASGAYNINNWLSGVADLGGYHTNNILGTGLDGTLSTYLFGPRVSYRHFSRVTPFGEVLFGVAHAGSDVFGTTNSQNAFAMTVGGGFDYRVSSHWSLRPAKVDYLLTRFSEPNLGTQSQNNLRVSTGVVFRF
jgi:opacity protein-like surface antigen